MRTSKNYLFIHYYSNGVSHYYLHLAEIQRPSGEFKSVQVERREGFRYALIRSCWYEEVGEELTRSRVPYRIDQEHIWFSLDSPKFEARKKNQGSWQLLFKFCHLGQITTKGCGSEFYFYLWPGNCPFVYSFPYRFTHISLLNYFWRPLGSSVS